jgi:hypothetical protein
MRKFLRVSILLLFAFGFNQIVSADINVNSSIRSSHNFIDILLSDSGEVPISENPQPAVDSPTIAKKKRNKDTTGIWAFQGTSTVNTNQNSFLYWQGGGQSSVSVATVVNAVLTFTNESTNWQTQVDMSYGLMNQQSVPGWNKTDDAFAISSKYGKRASKSLFYSLLFNPATQFQPGYEMIGDSLPISKMLAPLYAETALGFNYVPNNKLDVFLGLGTLKSTVVNDQRLADQGAYGVQAAVYDEFTGDLLTPGKKIRSEFGGYMLIQYRNPRIIKNLGIQSRLELFTNYLNKPENIDIDWQNTISIQLNEYIAANINIHMKYDDDIKIGVDMDGDGQIDKYTAKMQFKEVLGVGLNINLSQ